jgi:hypothetical protein
VISGQASTNETTLKKRRRIVKSATRNLRVQIQDKIVSKGEKVKISYHTIHTIILLSNKQHSRFVTTYIFFNEKFSKDKPAKRSNRCEALLTSLDYIESHHVDKIDLPQFKSGQDLRNR